MSWRPHSHHHSQNIYPTEWFISLNLLKSFNMDRIFFDTDFMKAVRDQKHHSEDKNDMKEFYWKNFLIKVDQQPQIWDMTSGMKDTSQCPPV